MEPGIYLRLRSCRYWTIIEVVQDLVVGLLLVVSFFFALPLASISLHWHCFVVVTAVVSALVLPFFSTVVGVAFAIVVNHKIILVQATSDDLLVVLLSNFIIDVALIFNLVRVKSGFA